MKPEQKLKLIMEETKTKLEKALRGSKDESRSN